MATLEQVDGVIVRAAHACARGYLPPTEDVDDLIQLARIAVWQALPRYPERDPSALAVVITRRVVVDAYRRAKANRSIPVDEFYGVTVVDPRPDPEDWVVRTELRDHVMRLLDLLPEQQRTAVVLRALGYSQAETGAHLGIRQNAAAVRAHRGIAALRRALDQRKRPCDHLTPKGATK
jgi:RNA polymerase sigma-70 factor (ECF subfamily)